MANKREKAEVEVLINAQKGNASIKELEGAVRVLRNQLNKLPTDSQEFINKSKQFQDVKTRLDEVKQSVSGVHDGLSEMWKVAGGMGIAELAKKGFEILKQGFFKVVESTKGTADQFKFEVDGMKSGVNQFFKILATGDWSNWTGRILEAIKVGRQYSEMLDELEESNKALRVKISETNLLNAQETRIYRDATKSRAERIAAIDRLIANEEKLSEIKERLTKKDMDNELMSAQQQSKLTRKEILDYIENFNAQEKLRAEAEKYGEVMLKLHNVRKLVSQGVATNKDVDRMYALEKAFKETSPQIVSYYVISEKMKKLNDSGTGSFDLLTQKISAHTDAYTEFFTNTQRAAAKKGALIEGLETEGVKIEKAAKKEIKTEQEKQADIEKAKWDAYWDSQEMQKIIDEELDRQQKEIDKKEEEIDKKEEEKLKNIEDFNNDELDLIRKSTKSKLLLYHLEGEAIKRQHAANIKAGMSEVDAGKKRDKALKTLSEKTQQYYQEQFTAAAENVKSVQDAAKTFGNVIRQEIKQWAVESVAAAVKNALISVPWPFNIALAGAAAIATQLAFNKLIPEFSSGGPTANISPSQPAGIVHGQEYVIPAWQRRTPYVMSIEPMLEAQRVRGYASGGPVSSTQPSGGSKPPEGYPSPSPSDPELKSLISQNSTLLQFLIKNGVKSVIGQREIYDINDEQSKLSAIQSKADRYQ